MIIAKVVKQRGKYYSFSCEGHAEFNDSGKDIVCAAVSMLVINTGNSLEAFTDNKLVSSDCGKISWTFVDTPDEKGVLLMDSLCLGLAETEKRYGKKYLRLIIEEV